MMEGQEAKKNVKFAVTLIAALILVLMPAGLSVAEEAPSSAGPEATGILDAPWRFCLD